MNKKRMLFNQAKKIITLGMTFIMALSITACGPEVSEFKQKFEASSYKKLSIYKGYNTNYQDFSNFEKGHGYLSIESEDDGNTIVFEGLYQIKSVHIGTQDLTDAFKTDAVKEFTNLCGYKEYESLANDESFQCVSNELFNYNGYVVYCELLETGGANLYLGKKFKYDFENNNEAISVYNRAIELLNEDYYDKFNYQELKDEYGNLKDSQSFQYALVLGLNDEEGTKKDVLVGETKYTYNFYSEMESFLFLLDKELSNVSEKCKNNNNTQAPVF